MTVENIINQLASHLYSIGFVSKSGGLANLINVSSGAGQSVMVSANVHPFSTPSKQTISPDNKEAGIAFWRASATRISNQSVWLSQQENDITLTVWVNGNKSKHGPETDFMQLVKTHFNRYSINLEPGSPIRTAQIELIGDSIGEVVSGLGWDESQYRYNEPPHVLFNVRFRLVYTVGKGCSTPTVNVINAVC